MVDSDEMLAVRHYLLDFQDALCQALAKEEETAVFREDNWNHEEGGGGRTRILCEGAVLEKAGVNFSHIHGKQLPKAATLKRPQLEHVPFEVVGVSAVIHPQNPYVPASHMNLRFFRTKLEESTLWWFGGGFDLTPYYPFLEDAIYWHQVAEKLCHPFGQEIYPRFKAWCDEYFYLPHRKEMRGIGGIFFDDLNQWSFEKCFAFIKAVGEGFLNAYIHLITKRKQLPYGKSEKTFQCHRRGRYVEFNLLYDRGTLFGLQSGGRVESILMSLPPIVSWEYNKQDCAEAEHALKKFLQPIDWVHSNDSQGLPVI